MEEIWLISCLVLLVVCLVTWKLALPTKRYKNLPPHPKPTLPIIGHLHLLKDPLHRTLKKLSTKYGPIFSLSFGRRLVVVVSSSAVAEECFTTNDIIFANRPSSLVAEHIGYNYTSVTGAPYGVHWRNQRRLCSEEIFSVNRLKNFQPIRQDETKHMLQSLFDSSKQSGSAKVVLTTKFSELTFNVIMRIVAGKRYCGDESNNEEAIKVRKLINRIFEQAQSTNAEDLFPLLKKMDLRGIKNSLASLGKQLDDFYQDLIDEHRREKKNTLISHLLSLQQTDPQYYTDHNNKSLITALITAGIDTSTSTIEWAMSELLNHPDVLEKARNELDSIVGHDRLVDEEDLANLQYLQNIILETFRLYPPGPFLLPHFSSKDCIVQGYDIPSGTMLLVNVWAIHRDPLLWDNPTSFRPERFEGKNVNPFALMPFGRGRRQCPGSTLAQKVVGLTLASLIHCFDLKRVSAEKVNMEEGNGLNLPKVVPLEAICTPRKFMYTMFE